MQRMDRSRAEWILDSIGDAVLSTDRAWLITYLNPVAERMLGWSMAEAMGQHLSDVFSVLDRKTRERLVPDLESAVKLGRTVVLPPDCVLVRRDGQEVNIEDSAAPILDELGRVVGMVVVFHDVGAAQAMAQKLSHLAEHDVLTALPNRALLDDRLAQAISLASRYQRQLAVLFVDLDHFKGINDTLGHLVGDQLLRAVADRIRPCVRASDTVSRQGGDEFIVLLAELNSSEDAGVIAEKVRLAVMQPFTIEGHYLQMSTSIGISVYPGDGEDAETLIRHADTAMYHAKEMGKNHSQYFSEDMNLQAAERQMIAADLQVALASCEFFLRYQPTINLLDGAVVGVEALLHWHHPSRGVLHPDRFIAIAEDCGLLIPIGRWILQEACSQAQRWIAAGLALPSLSVNISAVEFRKDDFVDAVCSIIEANGLPPTLLQLELTETTVMRNIAETDTVLRRLNERGIRIIIDQFGTGYTNLSHLKRFPVTALKLARSSMRDVPGSSDTTIIVRSVIQMAHSLSLKVIADGIDGAEQVAFLQAHDCEEAQGDYLSRPLAASEMQALLTHNPMVMAWLRKRVNTMLTAGPADGSWTSPPDDFAGRLGSIVRTTERSSVAVSITDACGSIVWVNEAFSRLCGYTLEEAVGQTPAALLQGEPPDREETTRMQAALRGARSVSAELTHYTKDGHPYRIALAIDPVCTPSGEVDAFVGYSTILYNSGQAAVLSLDRRSHAYVLPGRGGAVKASSHHR